MSRNAGPRVTTLRARLAALDAVEAELRAHAEANLNLFSMEQYREWDTEYARLAHRVHVEEVRVLATLRVYLEQDELIDRPARRVRR